jgi:hypothetical protein
MQELIQKVIEWANDRNIIQGSTAIKQLDKTSEEFNELQRAVAELIVLKRLGMVDEDLDFVMHEVEDAFGDILVTLILASAIIGVDLEDCLVGAYNTIKDRKGKMINGKFVKEEDL